MEAEIQEINMQISPSDLYLLNIIQMFIEILFNNFPMDAFFCNRLNDNRIRKPTVQGEETKISHSVIKNVGNSMLSREM